MSYFKPKSFFEILNEQLQYMTIEEWREINNRLLLQTQINEMNDLMIKEYFKNRNGNVFTRCI